MTTPLPSVATVWLAPDGDELRGPFWICRHSPRDNSRQTTICMQMGMGPVSTFVEIAADDWETAGWRPAEYSSHLAERYRKHATEFSAELSCTCRARFDIAVGGERGKESCEHTDKFYYLLRRCQQALLNPRIEPPPALTLLADIAQALKDPRYIPHDYKPYG